jgi:hypothetical protein
MSGLYVKAERAAEVVRRLAAIAAKTWGGERVNFEVTTNVTGLGLSLKNVGGTELLANPQVAEFVERHDEKPFLMCTNATVSLHTQNAFKVHYHANDQVFGTLTLDMQGDVARTERTIAAAAELFRPSAYRDEVLVRVSEAERNAMQIRERSVTDLAEHLRQLGVAMKDVAAQGAAARIQLEEKLTEDHLKRRTTLDEEDRRRREEFARTRTEQEAELAKRAAEHDAKVEKFETREAKHVRRDLLEKINKVLEASKDFNLSKGTGDKRDIVHVFTWLLMAVAVLTGRKHGRRLADGPRGGMAPLRDARRGIGHPRDDVCLLPEVERSMVP